MTDILKVTGLTKSVGKVTAVDDLSFSMTQGEILGMMGPNGAGKTSVFNLLSGVFRPDSGKIEFGGEDITGLSSSKRCKKGIGEPGTASRKPSEIRTRTGRGDQSICF